MSDSGSWVSRLFQTWSPATLDQVYIKLRLGIDWSCGLNYHMMGLWELYKATSSCDVSDHMRPLPRPYYFVILVLYKLVYPCTVFIMYSYWSLVTIVSWHVQRCRASDCHLLYVGLFPVFHVSFELCVNSENAVILYLVTCIVLSSCSASLRYYTSRITWC